MSYTLDNAQEICSWIGDYFEQNDYSMYAKPDQ